MKYISFLILFSFYVSRTKAQSNLEAIISQAVTTSPEAKVLKLSNQQNSYNNSLQLVSLKPSLSLSGNLPGFTRSISNITQPDGSFKFQTQSQAYSSFGINGSQAIPLTGGRISLNSGLNRIDLFDPNRSTAWSSNLFVVNLSQPLLQFNELKYLKPNLEATIELNKVQNERDLALFNQKIANLVLDYYYVQKQNELLSEQLKETQETITRTSYLVQAGKILQEDVDLLILDKNKAENDLKNLQLQLALSHKQLEYHFKSTEVIKQIEVLDIAYSAERLSKDDLLALASKSTTLLGNVQSIEQAKQNVERQKLNNGLSANVDVSFGYNQQADEFAGIYENPLDRQMASVSLLVPILDGGRAKYNQLLATNQLEQAEIQQEISKQALIQQVDNILNQFEQLSNEFALAESSLALAKNRETKYANLLQAGKVTVDQYLESQNYRQNIELNLLATKISYWKLKYSIIF